MVWLIGMVACGGSSNVTTERAFVGQVIDAGGQPLEGVLVQSMEAQAYTDASGRFVVQLKPDTRLTHFTSRGVWYRYRVREADLGQVVPLQVPTARAVALQCPPTACDLQLDWPLSEGFEAQVRPACAPGKVVALDAIPDAVPQVVCSVGKGVAKHRLPVAIDDSGDRIAVVERGIDVRVEVHAVEGTLPDDCRVHVGARVARQLEPGIWAAEAFASVTVGAQCGDSPAVPIQVDPTAPGGDRVTLEWVANGPTVELEHVAPWAEEVVVAAESAGWSLTLAPGDAGTIRLPPLAAGTYRVMVRAADRELPLAAVPPTNVPNGVLSFVPAGEDALVGRLTLAKDLEGGAIRVTLAD